MFRQVTVRQARSGQAGFGLVFPGGARCDMAGADRRETARLGRARYGRVRQVWSGTARYVLGMEGHGLVRLGRLGWVRLGDPRFRRVRHVSAGWVGHSRSRHGNPRCGKAGLVALGRARRCKASPGRHGTAVRVVSWQVGVRQASLGRVPLGWQDEAGLVRSGGVGHGLAWQVCDGGSWRILMWFVPVWRRRQGMAWQVRLGNSWHGGLGKVRLGSVGQARLGMSS